MSLLKAIGLVTALPHTVVGFALCAAYGWGRDWKWEDWCLKVTVKRAFGRPGAQTMGWLVMVVGDDYDRGRFDGFNERAINGLKVVERVPRPLWYHERHHVRQGMMFGPIYPIAYGIEFLGRFFFPQEVVSKALWNRSETGDGIARTVASPGRRAPRPKRTRHSTTTCGGSGGDYPNSGQ